MKKNIFVLMSLLIIYSLTSCTKETVITPTPADQITTELQKVISANSISNVIPWDNRTGFPTDIPTSLGSYWSFSNGFITIGGYGGSPGTQTRNLLYLDSYQISGTTLFIHFRS